MSYHMTIREAIKASRTPEIPFFRYRQESFKVFLWDDLTQPDSFDSVFEGIDPTGNFRVLNNSAITHDKYLPWYNIGDTSDMTPAFCLEDSEDLCYLNLQEHEEGNLYPMKGLALEVSLPILELLDCYYGNGSSSDRVAIQVYQHTAGIKTEKMFAWMTPLEVISQYDMTTCDYELYKDTHVTPFAELKTGGIYSFGGI